VIKNVFQNKNILSLLTNVSISAFGLLGFLLLTRSLDKENFGAWIIFTTASGLIEMMRFGLTRVALIRFLSGAETEQRDNIIGSNWLISFVVTAILAGLITLTYLAFSFYIDQSGYQYFFVWYPLLLFFNLPFNNALAIFEADQKFNSILLLRLSTGISFTIFLILNLFIFKVDLTLIIVAHLIVHLFASSYCVLRKLDGIQLMFKSSRQTVLMFLNFGKFTFGTLIGSSLLKSADVMIIGLSPMGASAVALYSIPLKLIELMQIPLRSFAITAYPKISRASIKGAQDEVIKLFYTYSGVTTLLFIPWSFFCFMFSKTFVLILGGEQYMDSIVPVVIFKIFAIYGFLLPMDRFNGIVLDAIDKPKMNFYKVLAMTITNVLGDIIAVFVFKSLVLVAVVTIFFTIAGQFLGWYFVSRYLPISLTDMVVELKAFCSEWIKKNLQKSL
jgi:O-antigen/teichoic acid export membrane protein